MDYARDRVETAVNGSITGLSRMMRVFLIEYLVHGNATKAAEAAGYANPSQQGSRLTRSKKILAAIDQYFHAQELSAAQVVARLSEQGRAAYADYLNADGTVDLAGMKRAGLMHLVKSVRPTAHGLVVEFHDAQSALVHVGRYHGLFTDRVEQTIEIEPIQYIEVTE